MLVVPSVRPETTPEDDTVATDVLLETQLAGVPDPARVIAEPTQTEFGPVIVGNVFTVMVNVFEQPKVFVQVINAVPTLTPVTNPLLEIVATAVLLEVHGFNVAAVAEPDNCMVAPTQTVFSPEIVGKGFTVTVTCCEALHPVVAFVAVTVYVVVVDGVTVKLEEVTPLLTGNVDH